MAEIKGDRLAVQPPPADLEPFAVWASVVPADWDYTVLILREGDRQPPTRNDITEQHVSQRTPGLLSREEHSKSCMCIASPRSYDSSGGQSHYDEWREGGVLGTFLAGAASDIGEEAVLIEARVRLSGRKMAWLRPGVG